MGDIHPIPFKAISPLQRRLAAMDPSRGKLPWRTVSGFTTDAVLDANGNTLFFAPPGIAAHAVTAVNMMERANREKIT